jgi:hypothetical protein
MGYKCSHEADLGTVAGRDGCGEYLGQTVSQQGRRDMDTLVLCLAALLAIGVLLWLWMRDLKRVPERVDKLLREQLRG